MPWRRQDDSRPPPTGEEELLRSRGVTVEVVNDPTCISLMQRMIAERPELWNEDIGE